MTLCECGHFASAHSENGCSECSGCRGYITPAERREQTTPTLCDHGHLPGECPEEGCLFRREVKNALLCLAGSMTAADDQARAMTDAELGALLTSGRWTTTEVHEAGRRLMQPMSGTLLPFLRRKPRRDEIERQNALNKIEQAREDGGALREAVVRGHGCCMVNDPSFDQRLWDEALRAQERGARAVRTLTEIRRYADQGRLAAIRQTLERLGDV